MSSVTKDDRVVAPLPRIFGRYLLIHRLSRGGMGEIFLARFGLAGFEKLAVIKKVLPHLAADEEFIARFVTEAQVAVKLQHANVAQVFEVGRVGNEYFLALEHIHGRDLRRTLSLLVDSGRGMPPDLALFIAREVANALAYAHRRVDEDGRQLNLVHCDISPPNVMLSFEGEVKIIDFGIAKSALKAMDDNSKHGFGKFGYMAPEQLIRGREVEARTDVYALGTVLFEMLTGTRLYELGDTPDYRELAKMAAKGQHPLPSDHDPALAPFDELVRRALKPNVDDRYATAAAFRDDIQRQLVALNPTISVDELAAFMRFMFAEDVIRQQEEIERLDKTQLSQWENELTSEAKQTVSFALAGVVDLTHTGLLDEQVRELGARAAGANGGAPTLASTRAEHTEIVGRGEEPPVAQRSMVGWIAAGLVIAVAGGALALAGGSSEPKSLDAGLQAKAVAADLAMDAAVELHPASDLPDVPGVPDELATETERGAAKEVRPRESGEKKRKREAERARRSTKAAADAKRAADGKADAKAKTDDENPDAEVRDEGTIARARAKFTSANGEYQRFRKKHGGQLHGEWTEILKFATFAKNDSTKAASLVRKINRFRAKMRKIERETL